MNSFYDHAQFLGHDISALQSGEEVRSWIQLENMAELRHYLNLNQQDEHMVKARLDALEKNLGPLLEADWETERFLRRMEAFIYGNRPLSEEDLERSMVRFPLKMEAVSIEKKILNPGEEWVLAQGVRPAVIYNVGTLIMEPGSCMKIANTPLLLAIDEVVVHETPTHNAHQLQVLGIDPSTYQQIGTCGARNPPLAADIRLGRIVGNCGFSVYNQAVPRHESGADNASSGIYIHLPEKERHKVRVVAQPAPRVPLQMSGAPAHFLITVPVIL